MSKKRAAKLPPPRKWNRPADYTSPQRRAPEPTEPIDLAERKAWIKATVEEAKARGRKEYRRIRSQWKRGICHDFAHTFGRDGLTFPKDKDRRMYAGSLCSHFAGYQGTGNALQRLWRVRTEGFEDIRTYTNHPGDAEEQRRDQFRDLIRHYYLMLWTCRAYRHIERSEPEPAPPPPDPFHTPSMF